VPRRIASFVLPAGYTFNMDGTTLYLALASVFVAQAAGIAMPLSQQLLIMVTLMLTSIGDCLATVLMARWDGSFMLSPDESAAPVVELPAPRLPDIAATPAHANGNR